MLTATPQLEYDSFDYDVVDEPSLTLEEAIQKAAELKKSDGSNFHRVVPSDQSLSSFRVKTITKEEAYYDLVGKAASIGIRLFGKLGRSLK